MKSALFASLLLIAGSTLVGCDSNNTNSDWWHHNDNNNVRPNAPTNSSDPAMDSDKRPASNNNMPPAQ